MRLKPVSLDAPLFGLGTADADGHASYRVNRHLTLSAELLRYLPDPALRRVGADTADYAELVTRVLF